MCVYMSSCVCVCMQVGVAQWKQLEVYAVGGWLPQSSTTNTTHTAQTTTATSSTSGSESVSGGGSGSESENGNSSMRTSGAAHECACNICSAIRNMHTTHVMPSDRATIPDSSDTDSERTLDETVCNMCVCVCVCVCMCVCVCVCVSAVGKEGVRMS